MRQAPEQPAVPDPTSVGVLTCFYHAVEPSELRQSMESILGQDRPPQQWAVVADGPVDEALLDVVRDIQLRWSQAQPVSTLHFIELPENVGNAQARAVGMSYLSTEFVAVQDADDISAPDRLSRTVQFIEQERLDFAGSFLAEFADDPANPHLVRTYPVTVEQLRRAVRLNNPVGHPSFVFRRAAALEAGGYQHLPGNEDYDLIARMVANGFKGANLGTVLVQFRAHPNVFRRRGGMVFVRSELELSRRLRSYGLIGPVERWPILLIRLGYRLAPARLKQRTYAKVVATPRG